MKKLLLKIKKIFNINSFFKILIFIIIIHGMVCISASYVLAFFGREQIAEELSKTVVTEIVGPVIVYGFKSLFENISKYNNWVKIIKGEESYERYSDDSNNGDTSDSDCDHSEAS